MFLDGKQVITGTIIDITESHKNRINLEASEYRFRSVFESSNIGTSITPIDGEIDVNQALGDMLGYRTVELKGRNWRDITPRDDIEPTQKILFTLINGENRTARFRKRYIRKDGTVLTGEVSIGIARNQDLKLNLFITTIVEISEKVESEERLVQSERKFRSLFEQATVGVTIIETKTWRYHQINQKHCDIVGYRRNELMTIDFLTLTHPEDRLVDMQNKQRMINGEIDTFFMVKRYIQSNGSIVWVNLNVTRLWIAGEEPLNHVVII